MPTERVEEVEVVCQKCRGAGRIGFVGAVRECPGCNGYATIAAPIPSLANLIGLRESMENGMTAQEHYERANAARAKGYLYGTGGPNSGR